MGHPRKTKAKKRMIDLYIELANKNRTTEEEKIFQVLEIYCSEKIENSPHYYYELHKKHAKVGLNTFLNRYYTLEYSKWESLTLDQKEIQRLKAKKLRETLKENYKDTNKLQTEQDIIRFLENGLVLSRRQLKYIESNPAFAEKLKKEGIC